MNALHLKSERGLLPLRDPIFRREWETVLRRLRDGRFELEEPSQRDVNGEVLLHLACKRGPLLDVTEKLILLHPSGVEEVNKHDDTVLHLACYYGARVDVINCLRRRHPIAISKRNRDGKTPLEIAQEHKWDFYVDQQGDAIRLLRKATYPESFDAEDKTGLPNKSAFKMWAHLPSPGATGENVILVFCDISGFKAVNTHDGYDAGDELIKRYARDICSVCDASLQTSTGVELVVTTEVFRMGGDEFALVAKFSGEIMNAWNKCFDQMVSELAALTAEKPLKYYTFLRLGCVAGRAGDEPMMKYLLEMAENLQKEIGERIDPNRIGKISLAQVREVGISNSSRLMNCSEIERKYLHQEASHSSSSKGSMMGATKSEDVAVQEIHAYFIFEPLPSVLGPKDMRNVQYITRIVNHIEDQMGRMNDRKQHSSALHELMRKELSIAFADSWDKALCDMNRCRINMVVWCAEGVDLLAESPFKCQILPQLVVVVMKYGSRAVAHSFQEIGVSTVIWIPLDPYELHPLDLFNPILVSFCELMTRQSAGLEESFERWKKTAEGSSRIDTSLWGFEAETHRIPLLDLSRTIMDGQLQVLPQRWTSICCETNLVELSSSKRFHNLKMQIADIPAMAELRDEIIDHARSKNDENRFLHICPPVTMFEGNNMLEEQLLTRSRAFAWEVCRSFLHTSGIVFHSGVFYVSYTNKNDISLIERQVALPVERLLLWVDLVDDEDSHDLDCVFKKWLDCLTTNSFIIFTQEGVNCDRVDKLVGSGKCRRIHVSTENISASSLHENIRLNLSCKESNVLNNVMNSIDKVEAACRNAVLTFDAEGNPSTMVAAVYSDGNDDGQFESVSLVFRICCCNINYMTKLRDRFLICGETEKATVILSRELGQIDSTFGNIEIAFDRTAFANAFEGSVLRLEEMTKHQCEKLNECKRKLQTVIKTPEPGMRYTSRVVDFFKSILATLTLHPQGSTCVHIRGPAGSGKTFFGINFVEEFLQSSKQQNVLYVSPKASLGLHFVSWLCRRINDIHYAEKMLERMFLLNSTDMEVMGIYYNRGRASFVRTPSANRSVFGLILVDEAHHIFDTHDDNMATLRSTVTDLVTKSSSQVNATLLLSDVSQASSVDGSIRFPNTPFTIDLSEVVRSSKRIVAGSMLYQLGNKLHTSCAHDSLGPLIKTYIFKLVDGDKFQTYANKISKALKHLLSPKCFPGLELHNRVAILGPNVEFCKKLEISLKHELATDTTLMSQNISLVSALEASESISLGIENRHVRKSQSVVLDSVSEFHGQERLLVFGVGLDRPINDKKNAHHVRCRIYQTISRAQMAFYLINECVNGGWFEWIHLHGQGSGTEFPFEEFVKSINDASSNMMKMDEVSTLSPKNEVEGGDELHRTQHEVNQVVKGEMSIDQHQQYNHHHSTAQERSLIIENFNLFDLEDNDEVVVELVNANFLPLSLRIGLPRTTALDKWEHLPPPDVEDASVFVLYITISGFEAVNDKVNLETGYKAIKQYASSITESCEKYAMREKSSVPPVIFDVYRSGVGGEFVVVGKFARSYTTGDAVWESTMEPLVKALASLTFEDSEDPCRYSTFLRIGCCAGDVARMSDLLRKAEELQAAIEENMGLERGEFISLEELRQKSISNFSECVELLD